MRGWMATVWRGWQRLARRIGEFQSRVLLAVLYAAMVMPLGLILRLFRDPLRRRRPAATNWVPRAAAPNTLDEARRQ